MPVKSVNRLTNATLGFEAVVFALVKRLEAVEKVQMCEQKDILAFLMNELGNPRLDNRE